MIRANPVASLQSQRGFTLLELVVSLAILGLLLPLAFAGLRSGLATWESVEDRLTADNDQMLAHDFLRRQLERAQLPTRRDLLDESQLSFGGEADRLHFVAPLPAHLGRGGLYRFELGVNPDSQAGDVVLTYRLYLGAESEYFDGEEPQSVTLYKGVERLQISYLVNGSPRQATDWRGAWNGMPYLPRLVRLQFTMQSDRRLPIQEILVAPRLAQASIR